MPPHIRTLAFLAFSFSFFACDGAVDLKNPPPDGAPIDDAGGSLPMIGADSGTPELIDAGTEPLIDAGTEPIIDAGTEPVIDAGMMTRDAGPLTTPVLTTHGYAGMIHLQKISPANYSTLALANGVVKAVGEVTDGTFNFPLPAGVTMVDIATGGHADAALDSSGKVWLWYGYQGAGNTTGDMGDGSYTTGDYYLPRVLTQDIAGHPFDHVVKIIPTFTGSYAIKDDGSVWAWGSNGSGESGGPLPTGSCPWLTATGPVPGTDLHCYVNRPTKLAFPAGVVIQKVVAATDSSPLALDSQGRVWGWGGHTLVNGNFTKTNTPTLIAGIPTTHPIIDIAVGTEFFLALDDTGKLFGWGFDHGGAYLGKGDGHYTWLPTPTPFELTAQPAFSFLSGKITRIESSSYAMFAFNAAGDVYAWGDQTLGGVGTGSTGVSRGRRGQRAQQLELEWRAGHGDDADQDLEPGASGLHHLRVRQLRSRCRRRGLVVGPRQVQQPGRRLRGHRCRQPARRVRRGRAQTGDAVLMVASWVGHFF